MEDAGSSARGLFNPALMLLVSAALLAGSGPIAFLFHRRPTIADRVGTSVLVSGAILGLFAAARSALDGVASIASPWFLPWGRFSVAIDGLSAAFLFPILLVTALASIYGLGYWPQRSHPTTAGRVRFFFGFLAAAMTVLVVARDAVLFLIAFEVMTLAVFFLVTTEHEKREVRDAGWTYLAASHVSFLLLLAVFYGFRLAGGSFDLTAPPTDSLSAWGRTALFLGAFVAFAVKAGVMPFHVWLPAAHANAPSHVSAVLSGVVIKTGIYAILRVLMMLPDPPAFWGVLLLVMGAVSGVVGVVYAIGQHDLKRLLAYHSIENIGIIVMGLGMAVTGRATDQPVLVVLGFGAAVLHVWNHAIFKSLLFFSAGSVVHVAGTREIDRLGGLGRTLPWTAAFFVVGAAAICGLPPLNGFVSEFFLYVGGLYGLQTANVGLVCIVAPVLALIGALACACFVKVVGTVFLGTPRFEASTISRHGGWTARTDQGAKTVGSRECPWTMRIPMLLLAASCFALGIAPVLVAPILDHAAAAWMGSEASILPAIGTSLPFRAIAYVAIAVLLAAATLYALLRRRKTAQRELGTWDCGYLAPTARMQYTGSSFARSLVTLSQQLVWFREHRPVFPRPIVAPTAYHGRVDDVVLDRWLRPAARWCAEQSDRLRHRQSARVQTYITYVAFTTLALLLLPIFALLRRIVQK